MAAADKAKADADKAKAAADKAKADALAAAKAAADAQLSALESELKAAQAAAVAAAATSTTAHVQRVARHELEFDELSDRLGEGAFAVVYRAHWACGGGQTVAFKRWKAQSLDAISDPTTRRELDVMARLRHPNVCALLGVCDDAGQRGLLIEYLSLGSLGQLLYKQKIELPLAKQLGILRDIARGLA